MKNFIKSIFCKKVNDKKANQEFNVESLYQTNITETKQKLLKLINLEDKQKRLSKIEQHLDNIGNSPFVSISINYYSPFCQGEIYLNESYFEEIKQIAIIANKIELSQVEQEIKELTESR
jgi:hypothetical protein